MQKLITEAKKKYPASVSFTGRLSKEERAELEEYCDVRTPSVHMDGTVTYSIRYKKTNNRKDVLR